jgi:hypothetical protein
LTTFTTLLEDEGGINVCFREQNDTFMGHTKPVGLRLACDKLDSPGLEFVPRFNLLGLCELYHVNKLFVI